MIPGLDGLRAIAILLVFASHSDLVEFGWVGVQLFFVLSGFLITGILLDMKDSLPAGKYFTKFYGRRFLRIFPLYYFYLALMAVVAYWLISVDFRPGPMKIFLDQVWYAVLYVYDFFYRVPWFEPSHFLDHFWSLSVEEQFYIVWPLLLLLVPQKHLKRLFILFVILAITFRVLLYGWYLSGSSLWFFREPFGLVVYALPFSHLDAFAFGAYISRYEIWRPRVQLLILVLLVPAVGFTATYFTTGSIGLVSALGYDSSLENGYEFIWAHTLLNYLFAVLIYCVVREKVFVRFLEMPWLRYLGKISYGMYVYHLALIWFTWTLLEERNLGEIASWIKIAISLSATILVSTISYYWLERPILNWKDRFFAWSKTKTSDDERPSAIL
ncbi:MAG TPA: acyltransferase [Anaerolineales bacterium]|nr:acyltransferase [Anaerolineales bacterium]